MEDRTPENFLPIWQVWFPDGGEDVADATKHQDLCEELAARTATEERLSNGPDWEFLYKRPIIALVQREGSSHVQRIQVTVQAEPTVYTTRHIPKQD